MATTIEWFGTTTYRLKTNGLTIFLDTWIDRPAGLPKYLDIDDVGEVDYIFISHAHFDHMPGADRIAIKTGAVVYANAEVINRLQEAGVPEAQLRPVSGGERIPLFTKSDSDAAISGKIKLAEGLAGAPQTPHHDFAVMSVHVWPSLHCLMPGLTHADMPEIMDSGTEYTGATTPYVCSLDLTIGMKYGLLKLEKHVPEAYMDAGMRSFVDYVNNPKHVFSYCDGGQLAFNFLIGTNKTLLWSAHLGAYESILRTMEPKPNIAILAVAGRANLNGRPFDGSAAQFLLRQAQWLDCPGKIIWCLQDESLLKPYSVDTTAATTLIQNETGAEIINLKHAEPTRLFD